MERVAIYYLNTLLKKEVCYVENEHMINNKLYFLNRPIIRITKETLACVKEDNISNKYKTFIHCDDFYDVSHGIERELIIWALTLYDPTLLLLSKLKAQEHVLIKNEKNAIIKLALIDAYRKNLTMKELTFLNDNVKLLPTWLQPYK